MFSFASWLLLHNAVPLFASRVYTADNALWEHTAEEEEEEEDEDNMEEIDTDNIVGSRTRGKQIDYRKAAEEAKDELPDDDDEEDDEDFEDTEADGNAMEH